MSSLVNLNTLHRVHARASQTTSSRSTAPQQQQAPMASPDYHREAEQIVKEEREQREKMPSYPVRHEQRREGVRCGPLLIRCSVCVSRASRDSNWLRRWAMELSQTSTRLLIGLVDRRLQVRSHSTGHDIRSDVADTPRRYPYAVKVVRKYELNASQVSFWFCGWHSEVFVPASCLRLDTSGAVFTWPTAA